MDLTRRQIAKGLLAGGSLAALPAAAHAQKELRIGLVVKVLGINYFDVARNGAVEAAKELGGVSVIYAGPTAATVEQQITVLDTLIAQRVDALIISANDANALIPTTKKAMQRGITVLSFDSGIAPEGRVMQISAPHDDLIGANDIHMIGKTLGAEGGEIAILSATSQATNQNIWIEKMKDALTKPDAANLKLVGLVYGDDAADKSYREAQGLIKAHPNLRGIISPTAVGIIAACRAVTDAGLIGKVYVTGHGLPSEMKPNILSGVSQTFQLNPADLGYASTMFATMIVRGTATGKPGTTTKIGRLGDMTVEADGATYLKSLLVFDKSNIEQYAAQF